MQKKEGELIWAYYPVSLPKVWKRQLGTRRYQNKNLRRRQEDTRQYFRIFLKKEVESHTVREWRCDRHHQKIIWLKRQLHHYPRRIRQKESRIISKTIKQFPAELWRFIRGSSRHGCRTECAPDGYAVLPSDNIAFLWNLCSAGIFDWVRYDHPHQQVAPKKISGRKTLEPQRFLGFFRAIFQGGIQKISFPKNGHWGGLELPTQAFGGRFCGIFRKICPFLALYQ